MSASEGGASLAETALLITLVALAAAIALSFLGSSGDSSLDEAGKGIHQAPAGDGGAGGSGGGSGGSGGSGTGGSGGGGSGSGTTSPPAPTTAVPTSTTAPGPTTTTTSPPTTTTMWPTPTPATAALDGGSGVRSGSSRWNASADLQLDADGPTSSMAGTATVLVESWKANGQRATQTIEVTIAADGSAEIGTGPYNRTGSSRIEAVRYTVISIDLHDGREWDGEQPSIDISRP